MQESTNQRFKQAFDKLKEAGVFKTQREFVQPLEWNQSTLSDVLKNKRPLPMEIAITFCDKYKVNQGWLLYGKGKMFSDGAEIKTAPAELSLPELQKEIANLQEIISIKDKIIDAQGQALKMAEQLLLRNQKSLAQATQPKKN